MLGLDLAQPLAVFVLRYRCCANAVVRPSATGCSRPFAGIPAMPPPSWFHLLRSFQPSANVAFERHFWRIQFSGTCGAARRRIAAAAAELARSGQRSDRRPRVLPRRAIATKAEYPAPVFVISGHCNPCLFFCAVFRAKPIAQANSHGEPDSEIEWKDSGVRCPSKFDDPLLSV